MVSVYALKPGFQSLLRPLVGRLAALGVTANQVTIAACLLSLALGWDLAFGSRTWLLLPLFLPIRMAMNAVDGMLAREHGQASRLGAILNEWTDIVSDAVLTLPFAGVASPAGVAVAAVSAALTEVAGMAGPGRRYDGPFGKSDRAVALGFFGSWLALGWPVASTALEWAPAAWVLLCAITMWNRRSASVQ